MKPSSLQTLGVILIVLSVIALAIAICQITPLAFVDFPCLDDIVNHQEIKPSTRIVYCISLWPLQAISGGGIYDIGVSEQDEVTVKGLKLRRDGQTLYVNNRPLKVGENYGFTRIIPSISPWILFQNRFEIRNDGLLLGQSSPLSTALYVSGDVVEGWLPNPLGLLLLGFGIWLFSKGKKEGKLKLETNNMAKPDS